MQKGHLRNSISTVAAGFRSRFASVKSRLPGSSLSFGPPRRFGNCIDYHDNDARGTATVTRLDEDPTANLQFACAQNNQGVRIQFGGEIRPKRFVATLTDGRVLAEPHSLAVIDNQDRVLLDLSFDHRGKVPIHSIRSRMSLPKAERFNDAIALAVTPYASGNYCHWLLDHLPTVIDILQTSDTADDCLWIMDWQKRGYEIESLQALGIHPGQVVQHHEEVLYQAPFLHTTTYPRGTFMGQSWASRLLRETFGHLAGEHQAVKRVYICRGKSRHRRLICEDELVSWMRDAFDISPVYLEDLSWPEQIALFANAEVIIAPHGAGLANLVFCQPGTKVLEVFGQKYIPDFFVRLAHNADLDHRFITSNSVPAGTLGPFDQGALGDDIDVELSEIQRSIEKMLCS